MNELNTMLPNRFRYEYLENMPEDEAVEMIFKYSRYKHKDLTTVHGLTDTLEFETLDNRGTIKATWMEYVSSAFRQVNGKNAKTIVLYLCRHRDREVTRAELLEKLSLDIDDAELEKRLKALVKADIITQGSTDFRYRGVNDNIFDKVFRGVYQEEIREFDVRVIKKEYSEELEKVKEQYYRLLGKHNYQKGLFVEYAKRFNVDLFARAAAPGEYSLIGEVKSRDTRKFSREEAVEFEKKFAEVKKQEKIDRAVGFIFSRSGFSKEAEAYCKEKGIACSDDERWLGD